MKKISVVVPCYNEEESLPLFYEEMRKIVEHDYVDFITTMNPQKVVNGEEIEIIEPIPIKEGLLKKFFQK